MKEVGASELSRILTNAGIAVANPDLGIGRQLSFAVQPARTLVVHLVESHASDYVLRVVAAVLDIEEFWLLIPRYGLASRLGLPTVRPDVAAFEVNGGDRVALCSYLCTRDMSAGAVSSDLYVVAVRGMTIIRWDHHTADEGLVIEFRDIEQASRLLPELNAIGTEFEVFHRDG